MTAAEDWPITQEWKARGLHWHAYVEQRSLSAAGEREDRLRQQPAELLSTPAEVATWLDVSLRSAMALPPDEAGASDERDFSDSYRVHESLASRGESIYTGVQGDITFMVEAVTEAECQVAHDSPDVPTLRKRRSKRD